MKYVMVPVPEAIEAEVREYLQWHVATRSEVPPDPDAIAKLWAGADETMRTILWFVAERADAQEPASYTEVRERAGVGIHELVGLLTEISARSRDLGGPMAVILPRPDPRERPEGVTDFEHKICAMPPAIARAILELPSASTGLSEPGAGTPRG